MKERNGRNEQTEPLRTNGTTRMAGTNRTLGHLFGGFDGHEDDLIEKFFGRPKIFFDAKKLFGCPKKFFGRPKKNVGHPKSFLAVQKIC